MKFLIKAIVLIGLSYTSHSQTSISGNITDLENNPLIGVEIYIQKLHIGTTSDIDGNYTLKNLPHGKLEIIYSYYGFEPISKELDVHDNLTYFNIQLKPSVFSIDEVIISTPFNRLQSDNVMKVEQASISQMKKMGVTSLVEGIESISGVSQVATGTSIGKPVIRGLSGNRVLVYTQGIRLENQQFGDEHGLGLSESGIESVEVIKGPASLLYGSDALGGVIYFNPEKFAKNDEFLADFNQQYSSNTNGTNTSFGLKTSGNKWKYLVRGTYKSHLDYKIPNEDRVTNTRYNETNFNTGVGFSNQLITSELRYNFNNSNLGLTEGIEDQLNHRTPNLPYQEIQNHILSMHNHIHFDTSKLDIDLGYTFNNRQEFEDEHGHEEEHHDEEEEEGHEEEDHEEEEGHHDEDEHHGEEAALHMKLKTFNYDVKYHLNSFTSKQFVFGLQGMSQSNTNFGEELLIPNAQVNDLGFFATSTIDFSKTSLLAGIRFDTRNIQTEYHEVIHEHEIHVFEAIDKTYNSFTASLGSKFNLTEKLITRINLASGFRAPNLAELTSNGVHHGTNRFEIGNADLSNEQNFQSDVAIEYKSEHIELFANGFYNTINDYIYLSPTGEIEDEAPVYEYTQENANLYGGEFGLHLHPHPLDWLHLESSFEIVVGKQDNGNFLPLIPANKWNNTFRTEFKINNWLTNGFSTINVASWFDQNNISEFETATAGYTLLNIGVGGQVEIANKKFELSMNLNNALNKEYTAHLSRLKTFGIPNIGRNFVINLSFNL